VKQYSNECLSISNGKLFCIACREELSIKFSVITAQIKSSEHIAGKDKLKTKKKRDTEIAKALKLQDSVIYPKGESLSDNQ